MAETPGLDITLLTEGQGQKEVTVNEALTTLDGVITQNVSQLIGNTNVGTITTTQLQDFFGFTFNPDTPAPNATITVTIDAGVSRGIILVTNNTLQSMNMPVSGQSQDVPLLLPQSSILMLVSSAAANQITQTPLIEAIHFDGRASVDLPTGITTLFYQAVMNTEIIVPVDLAGSEVFIDTPPTSAMSLNIRRNNGNPVLGSIDFAAGNGKATYTFTSEQTFQDGERLSIMAPVDWFTATNISLSLIAVGI